MTEVRRQRLFRRSPERVWQTLVSPAGLETWLGKTDLILEEGRVFSLEIAGPLGRMLRVTGEVMVVEPPSRLALIWRHGSQETRLFVRLDQTDGGTRLTLRHRGFRGLLGAVLVLLLSIRYHAGLARLSGGLGAGALAAAGSVLAVGLAVLLMVPLAGPVSALVTVPASEAAAVEQVMSPAVEPPAAPSSSARLPRERASTMEHPSPVVPSASASVAPVATPTRVERAQATPRADPLGELLVSLSGESRARLRHEPEPKSEVAAESTGTLRLSGPMMVGRLSPLDESRALGRWLQDLIFDRLFEVVDGEVVTNVVEAHRAWPDGKGLTLELRRDLRWHDGERVRPRDVCASVAVHQNPALESAHAEYWRERIAACEVRAGKVELTLTRSWTDPRLALDLPLLAEHQIEAAVATRSSRPSVLAPLGSGPMLVTPHRRGLTLTAAQRGSREPGVSKVVWRAGGDARALIHELADAELDGLLGVPGEYLPELREAGAALYPLSALTHVVALDAEEGPTADPMFRQQLVAVLEGERLELPRTPLRVRIRPGYPEALALEAVNAWSAAGLAVEVHRTWRSSDPDFDVMFSAVELLDWHHPVQALVDGRGNPFELELPEVRAVLSEQGSELPSSWMRVARLLEQELYTHHVQGTESSWMALGPKVRVGQISPSRPLLNIEDWSVVEP